MPNTRTTRTLLDWARDVSRTSAIMRVEPTGTSTKELQEMIEAADAALHTTPELDEVEALAQAERDEPVVLSMYSSKWGDHERALLQALAARGYRLIRDFGVPASPAPEAVEALGSLSDYTCSHSPDRPWIFKDEALAALPAQREPASEGARFPGTSVSVVMPSGHRHTLSHVTDYDGVQEWDCGRVRVTVEADHLVTVDLSGVRHTTPELDDRCTFCWHDKGHHVHWREDDIGSCVLIMASTGRQHHKCPCEEYVAPAAYRDAVEAERRKEMSDEH